MIHFSHPMVREYLLAHGRVYTFRTKKRKDKEKDWASSGRGKPKIADVKVTFIKRIDAQNLGSLKKYSKESGFEYVADWITAIQNINETTKIDGYLYLVVRITDS